MPVIANQKKPADHPLYCPPDVLHPAAAAALHGLPAAAYHGHHPSLNGNSLRRTLEEYRAHHQACAARRRHSLEYELRVEAQRTEWLTRKFMDGVRPQSSSSSTQQQGQGQAGGGGGGGGGGRGEQQQQRSQSTTSEGANATASEDTVTVKQQPPSPDGLLAALTMDTTKQSSNDSPAAAKPHLPHPITSTAGSSTQLGECLEGGASGTGAGLQRQASNGRASKHATPTSSSAGMTLNLSNGTGMGLGRGGSCSNKTTKNGLSNGVVDQAKVIIKREPESLDAGGGHRQCSRSPTTSAAGSGRRLSLTGKDGKRSQRLSSSQKSNCERSMRSFSMSEDMEDDLKLKAADCMGGVISTPPIKPLEEGDDIPITTPSPPTSAGLLSSAKSTGSGNGSTNETPSTSFSVASTTTHSTSSHTNASHVTSPTNSVQSADLTKKQPSGSGGGVSDPNASLMQELDDFSKILFKVAADEEQRANEERYQQRSTDAFHGTPSHDTTPHVPRPSHLSHDTAPRVQRPSHLPPPYYSPSAASKPGTQQYYSPSGQAQYNGSPSLTHAAASVRDPSLYIGVDYHHTLQQRHMNSAQVNPTTFAPRPDHLQPHHLSGTSPQVHPQPPTLGQTPPTLVSPTVRLPLPHTPISSHMPPFPDPVVSSVTTPTMPPHTPTTPLEHFSTFPAAHQHPTPPSQLHSPTHPQYVPQPGGAAGGVPISSTEFSFTGHKVMQEQLRSPTVTTAGFNWQGGSSLRDQMLAQVKSQIETRIGGGQKRQSQDAGFPVPPPTKMVAAGSTPYAQLTGHSHMTMRPSTPQQQQYLSPAPPTGSSGPVGYTGLSQQPPQLVRSLSYQPPGAGQLTSAPAYPHHHI